jgi:hypothetical protein
VLVSGKRGIETEEVKYRTNLVEDAESEVNAKSGEKM